MTMTITSVSRDFGTHAEIADESILYATKVIVEDILYLYDESPNKNTEVEELEVYREMQYIKPDLEKIARGGRANIFFGTLMELFDKVSDLQDHIKIPLDEYKRIEANYSHLLRLFPIENTSTPRSKPLFSEQKVSYDEITNSIYWGNKSCKLPSAKNESDLARAMFKRKKGESVDWSIINSEITGNPEIGGKSDMKRVMDTVIRVNKKLREEFGVADKLFTWKKKTVTRNH